MPTLAKTPLLPITIDSIYQGPLPARMALCTPDTRAAVLAIVADLATLDFHLKLSDMFRSHDMQKQANLDYVQGRKKAFSPPPGGSMHEAGRSMDIDLSTMGVPLKQFWDIALSHGMLPIIAQPNTALSESWHFDCRGSHGAVYEYAQSGKAGSIIAPYTMMAQSSINAIGVPLDTLPTQDVPFLQSALIRLGFDPGRIDGVMGDRTQGALDDAGIDDDPFGSISTLLAEKFPFEYPA